MEISLISQIILYIIIVLFGLLAIIVFGWQIMVLRGKSMKNPDESVDDWHEQKLCYGIALADITIAVPLTLVGIVLILIGWRIGYYLTGLASFWFLWTNVMTTATSTCGMRLLMRLSTIIVVNERAAMAAVGQCI